MKSQIDLVNLALAKVSNGGDIESFGDGTSAAILARRLWDNVLNVVLAEHEWDFATRHARLMLLREEADFQPYAYWYQYPTDCIRIQRVFTHDDIRFRTGLSGDGQSRIIMASEPDALIRYTRDTVPPDLMPPHFADALVWRLVMELFMTQAKLEQADAASRVYATQLERAKVFDARESSPVVRGEGDWLKCRGAGHGN